MTGEQFRHRTAISEDQAWLDVAANGIWDGQFEQTFIDVRVFNPHALSNRTTSLASTYACHEKEKGVTSSGFGMWKVHHLSQPYLLPLEEWGAIDPCYISTLPVSMQKRRGSRAVLLWHGFVAASALVCCILALCAYRGLTLFDLQLISQL